MKDMIYEVRCLFISSFDFKHRTSYIISFISIFLQSSTIIVAAGMQ